MTDADLAVARLARKQHGAWSRPQAIRRGITRRMLDTRVSSGEWVRLDRSVYAHIASRPTWERSVMAAVLAEPWAVASHRSAAVIHELLGFRRGRPEITIRPGANARGRLSLSHRGADVRTTTRDGIPVVALDQCFVDIAQIVSESKLRAALADRADRRSTVLDAVRDRYCALAPRGGRDLRTLKAVLLRFGSGDLPETSELETRLIEVLRPTTMPPIEWQASYPGRCPGAHRVDGLVRPWRLILEADGRAWHTRIEDFERDRRRDAEAAAAGYLTLRLTWHQITSEARWVQRIVVASGSQRVLPVRGTSAPEAVIDALDLGAA